MHLARMCSKRRARKSARALLARAISDGHLDASYVDVDHKHRGSALNYELYDAKEGIALYQQRHTVCTKYGNSPTKKYFFVRRTGRKVSVEQLDAKAKAHVVKLAKASRNLGEVIDTLTGKAKHPLKAKAPANEAQRLSRLLNPGMPPISAFLTNNKSGRWVSNRSKPLRRITAVAFMCLLRRPKPWQCWKMAMCSTMHGKRASNLHSCAAKCLVDAMSMTTASYV